MKNPVYLVWIISLGIILLAIAFVLLRQVGHDLFSKGVIEEEDVDIQDNEDNPFRRRNRRTQNTTNRAAPIFEMLKPIMSLLSMLFSALIFGLVYNLFLKEFYEYSVELQTNLGVSTVAFLLSIMASSSVITRQYMKSISHENKAIRIIQAKSVVMTTLSFLFYLMMFVFYQEFDNVQYNLIKGISISFCIGVLFYIIFGQQLEFSFNNLKEETKDTLRKIFPPNK